MSSRAEPIAGIPAVQCIPNLASNETYSLDAQLTAGLGADHPAMAALAADCARFSAEHGVELDFAGTMGATEALNLVFVPREFQPAGDSFDERFRFLGPLLGNREQAESWSPPDPEAQVLFISLGTIFTDHPEFYRICIEAFGDGSWQVAMTVGEVDPAALGPIPATVDIRPRFPQLAVLRHAAAFVSHAGMNSTMEASDAKGTPGLDHRTPPVASVTSDTPVCHRRRSDGSRHVWQPGAGWAAVP